MATSIRCKGRCIFVHNMLLLRIIEYATVTHVAYSMKWHWQWITSNKLQWNDSKTEAILLSLSGRACCTKISL